MPPMRNWLPGLAPAADFVKADRHERADQRKAGSERIGQIDHAERGQAEQDHDAARGVERAEREPIERHRLEIAQPLPQRLGDIGAVIRRTTGSILPEIEIIGMPSPFVWCR